MEFETKRLILRPWRYADAESLYEYAKDPAVGPVAGWPPHTSVENSQEIIRDVLSADGVYAVCDKESGKVIGSIGLTIGKDSNLELPDTEAELGYWIGVPFWGRGLIPEAARELIRHGFEERSLSKIWCGYFDGNMKSRRVQEKCGFVYQYTNRDIYWKLMDDVRTEHITCLTKEEWEFNRGFLERYQQPDESLCGKFAFRNILPEEAEQTVKAEQICFPPNEACSRDMMLKRIAKAPELFLVAVDRATGRIAGFLNGLSTKEDSFRDEFFTDADLYDPDGENIMILGLDVLPEYRMLGLAREIVRRYIVREHENGRRMLLLTCLEDKIEMYRKMGFCDRGIANSSWGGVKWHEMHCLLHLPPDAKKQKNM